MVIGLLWRAQNQIRKPLTFSGPNVDLSQWKWYDVWRNDGSRELFSD